MQIVVIVYISTQSWLVCVLLYTDCVCVASFHVTIYLPCLTRLSQFCYLLANYGLVLPLLADFQFLVEMY